LKFSLFGAAVDFIRKFSTHLLLAPDLKKGILIFAIA